MASLRTPEGAKRYQEYLRYEASQKTCSLCDKESITNFKFWKIVKNSFPYDQIARIHHMLVPIRHVSEEGLVDDELKEMQQIKKMVVNIEYDWIIEATHKNKSIPHHFHLHLLVAKS